jgi:hypothetical protein
MHIIPADINNNKINTSSYELFFDSMGNAYLKNNSNAYLKNNDKVYQILIESDNNISLIYDKDFKFNPYNVSLQNMKLSTNPMSLKGKIIKQKIQDEDNDDDNESINSVEDEENNLNYQLYPEDLDYYQNENDIDSDDEIIDSFYFSSVNPSCPISVYDTD